MIGDRTKGGVQSFLPKRKLVGCGLFLLVLHWLLANLLALLIFLAQQQYDNKENMTLQKLAPESRAVRCFTLIASL